MRISEEEEEDNPLGKNINGNRWMEMTVKYLQGVAEEFLRSVKRNVFERMRVDLYDAISDGDASVPMDPSAGFDALH